MSCSCHGDSLRLLSPPDLSLPGRVQQRQIAIAFDSPQARLDEDHRTGLPVGFLVRGAPVIHLVGQLAELGVQGLRAGGGLAADPQSRKAPQAKAGYRLLKAFIQTGAGRDVEAPQLLTQRAQGRPVLGLRRALVGLLQPPTPGLLLSLRELSHHVLALVPLTPAGRGPGPRTSAERLCAAPLAPSMTQRRPGSTRHPRATSARRTAAQTGSCSVAVWTKPRLFFCPCRVIPTAMTMVSGANVWPSRTTVTNSSRSRRRSQTVCRGGRRWPG